MVVTLKDDQAKGVDPTDLKALTDYFHDSLTKALKPQMQVVDQPGPGVVAIRIALTDLVPTDVAQSVTGTLIPYGFVAEAGAGAASGRPAGSTPYMGRTGMEMQFRDGAIGRHPRRVPRHRDRAQVRRRPRSGRRRRGTDLGQRLPELLPVVGLRQERVRQVVGAHGEAIRRAAGAKGLGEIAIDAQAAVHSPARSTRARSPARARARRGTGFNRLWSLACVALGVALLPAAAPARAATQEDARIGGVDVVVWTPSTGSRERLAVVLFSHALYMCPTQSRYLTAVLADAGYLVIAPRHTDSSCGPLAWPSLSRMSLKPSPLWSDDDYRDRADDIRAVVDGLPDDPKYHTMANPRPACARRSLARRVHGTGPGRRLAVVAPAGSARHRGDDALFAAVSAERRACATFPPRSCTRRARSTPCSRSR